MALRKSKPVTSSRRGVVFVDRSELWAGRPEKRLTVGLPGKGGRNNTGRITARRRGGGAKRLCRLVDFRRIRDDDPAKVVRLEYDPGRTGFIALIRYGNGDPSYILAPQRLRPGDEVMSGEAADIRPGNCLPLRNMPVGTIVHCIELKAGGGAKLARAGGAYAQYVGRDGGYAQLRLASGEMRVVRQECRATVGAVSNPDNANRKLGKAGRARHFGQRPEVRGVAMNPVDHPHGGGEGRTSGGRHPVTPWGKPTKGRRTRGSKPSDKLILRSRHLRRRRRR